MGLTHTHARRHLIIATSLLALWVARASAQGQAGAASTGLLCISECVTCPVICSPPPSPAQEKPQPPPFSPPPPQPKPPKCPSPPPKPLAPPPPRFIYTIGGVPPPPRVYYGVFPAPPNGKGRPPGYEYPYPYYAYYSSAVAGCSYLSQLLVVFVLQMLFMVLL
uniref:Uncharacterized protein n=1 Tax=Kalanchoe fedtschenkoi TaxID=63787 RepID=A0A7N0V787_KALFE